MRPRWILLLLLLVAIAVLAWIAWPGGVDDGQLPGAGERGRDGSSTDLPHAEGDASGTPGVAAPVLKGWSVEKAEERLSLLRAKRDRAALAALIGELSSDDAEARRAAAHQIVSSYWLELVARQTAALDAESWQTFADAVIAKPRGLAPACALVAAAHAAPEAHRRRLIDLARRLNPEAGRTPTPQEIEALVHHELVENRGLTDHRSFIGQTVAIYGHSGMATALRLLREGDPDIVDMYRAGALMSTMAQPEDIPVLRGLLLEGKSNVASALGRLAALGFTEASDVLIEAVRSGRFDGRIARALRRTSKRRQAARAVREWIHGRGRSLTEEDRARIAWVFAALESRTDVPVLEAWSSSSRDEGTLVALGRALTQLGSVKGIDMLVRIVGEKKVDPPRRQGPEDTGRLSAGGFEQWRRCYALRMLNAVAVQLVAWEDSGWEDEQGPWKRLSYGGDLDQVVPAVRAWWEASRDRIQFDEKAGEWRLKSD